LSERFPYLDLNQVLKKRILYRFISALQPGFLKNSPDEASAHEL